MRIRSVKPEYWDDARLHNTPGITADVREFYIGTWGLADDLGWLKWNVPEIARTLYGYRGVKRRERQVIEYATKLVAIGRLHIYECGHAWVPNLSKHQHLAGTTRRVETVYKAHALCSPQIPADPRTSPPGPALYRDGVSDGDVSHGGDGGDDVVPFHRKPKAVGE